jgi:hypothetical protein
MYSASPYTYSNVDIRKDSSPMGSNELRGVHIENIN